MKTIRDILEDMLAEFLRGKGASTVIVEAEMEIFQNFTIINKKSQ